MIAWPPSAQLSPAGSSRVSVSEVFPAVPFLPFLPSSPPQATTTNPKLEINASAERIFLAFIHELLESPRPCRSGKGLGGENTRIRVGRRRFSVRIRAASRRHP